MVVAVVSALKLRMKIPPLVSVIIIFLNEERFLREAIESVIAQTYNHWELLLVDDGSTDQSAAIPQDYVNQYPNQIRYLAHENHQNLGMSASRNLGIRHASGQYIAYLDGDDVWFPHKLEQQVSILQSHPSAVMVYGPLQLWYSWTGDPHDQTRDRLYGLQAHRLCLQGDQLLPPPKLLTLFIRHKQLIPAGIMIQRDAIQQVGGYEDQFRGNYEDAVLLAKICLKFPVFVSKDCGYRYRQHPQSCTQVTRQLGQSDYTQNVFLNWLEVYFARQDCTDLEIWQALQDAKWSFQHPRLSRLLIGYQFLLHWFEKSVVFLGRRILPVSARNWLWQKWQKKVNFS